MKITIESTDRIIEIRIANGKNVSGRVWQGMTENGVQVACLVTRIVPLTDLPVDHKIFQAELQEVAPVRDDVADVFPLRLLL